MENLSKILIVTNIILLLCVIGAYNQFDSCIERDKRWATAYSDLTNDWMDERKENELEVNKWKDLNKKYADNYKVLDDKYQECNDLGYKVYDRGIEWKDLATECTAKIVRLSNTGYVYTGYSKSYWCSPLELW